MTTAIGSHSRNNSQNNRYSTNTY